MSPELLTRRRVTALLDDAGLTARRSLGQNFVVDPNTIRRIVDLAGVGPGDRVLELGPGLGSLTLGLLEAGAHVVAVEKDPGLAGLARDLVGDSVHLVVADALEIDLAPLVATAPAPWVVVANLPYNVATPLVLRLLDEVPAVGRLLVMVQQEVGERLVAAPGSAAYGIPSLRVAQWAEGRVVGRVGPDVFLPRPRVTSALVRLVRRERPAVAPRDEDLMWQLVRTSFGHRRKTLRRSLADLVVADDFAAAGVDPTERPEQLDLARFATLADAVSDRGSSA